jgi:hypothetical protein
MALEKSGEDRLQPAAMGGLEVDKLHDRDGPRRRPPNGTAPIWDLETGGRRRLEPDLDALLPLGRPRRYLVPETLGYESVKTSGQNTIFCELEII